MFAYTFFQKLCPWCALFAEAKKSPFHHLTERGAIPYNKGTGYAATCGLGPGCLQVSIRNRHRVGVAVSLFPRNANRYSTTKDM